MAVAALRGIRGLLRSHGSSPEWATGLAANPRPWHASLPAASPRGTREGARYGHKQARRRRTYPRLAAPAAALRVARAGALRADPPPGALRRLCGRKGRGGGSLRQYALPEARPLRGGRYGVPLRRAGRQAQEAAARRQAPHRRPQGRVPALQPQRDSQRAPRGLRHETGPALGKARALRGARAAEDRQELPALP